MFRLRLRPLPPHEGEARETLAGRFLQAIGFLGSDNPRLAQRQRATIGLHLFTRCLLPHPARAWTTFELAAELGVPMQSLYRQLKWLRETGLLTEDFPGRADDPKRVRLWHYDLTIAWEGVAFQAQLCLARYRAAFHRIADLLAASVPAHEGLPTGMMAVDRESPFELTLRELPPAPGDLAGELGRIGLGLGYLSSRHEPLAESIPYRLLMEFLQRPDRAWTADELALRAETSRPTIYRYLNTLLQLGLIARCRAADGGHPASAFHLRGGSLRETWAPLETHVELILAQYRQAIERLAETEAA